MKKRSTQTIESCPTQTKFEKKKIEINIHSPVEAARQQYLPVHNAKLVMHVMAVQARVGLFVDLGDDASTGKAFNVAAGIVARGWKIKHMSWKACKVNAREMSR
jgi:hypothetical protein